MTRLIPITASLLLFANLALAEVKQEVLRITLPESHVQKMIAFENTDKASYDIETKEYIFTVNQATGTKFRLVYDGKTVIAIIEGTDKTITTTCHTIEEFDTEKQALARIKTLGLEYDVGAIRTIDRE